MKYNSFLKYKKISESIKLSNMTFDLYLESIDYSEEFCTRLEKIDSDLSKKLLSYKNSDIEVRFDYIDIDDIDTVIIGTKSGESIKGRNTIKIGRLVRSILSSNNEKVSDSDLEKFVNQYKSVSSESKFSKIRLLSGSDITRYYNEYSYTYGSGTLQNSCMKHDHCSKYFDIYVNNPERIGLCCLFNEDDELLARALIWKLNDGNFFMDRVYTTHDYESDLMREYAKSKGWWYKKRDNSDNDCVIVTPTGETDDDLDVQLKPGKYAYYPYVDTIKYYFPKTGLITNKDIPDYLELEDTDGCPSRGGKITCPSCDGNCEVDCNSCDGSGSVECPGCDGEGSNECDKCDGSGYESDDVECTKCGGNGNITCRRCNGMCDVKCVSCNGEGSETCGRCDGDGIVDN